VKKKYPFIRLLQKHWLTCDLSCDFHEELFDEELFDEELFDEELFDEELFDEELFDDVK